MIEYIHIEPGNNVLCDFCGDDYTDSDEQGGIMFGSKATCPKCTREMMPNIRKYDEQGYIKAECPAGKSFADWVREDLR